MELRKDLENNNDDFNLTPENYSIKLACKTDLNIISDKKVPFICDPQKLRNTRKQLMTPSQNISSRRIINDKIVQDRNMKIVKNLILNIDQSSSSEKFNHGDSNFEDVRKSNNLSYLNVDFNIVNEFLASYNPHSSIKSDFDTLIEFISKNKSELNSWSVSIVNRGDKKSKYLSTDNNQFSIVKRVSLLKEDNSLYFPSILDGRNADNIFDIIDEQNIDEYRKNSAIAKNIRNSKKVPLLLIYPAHSTDRLDNQEFPLIYCFIPILKNAQKVSYIVRKK